MSDGVLADASAGRVSVGYLPGGWAAVVAEDVQLLAGLDPAGPVAAECWSAAQGGSGLDGVLAVLLRERVQNFGLAGRAGPGVRLLVAGAVQAEVGLGGRPALVSAAGTPGPVEQHLDGEPMLRFAVQGQPQMGTMLPLVGGVAFAAGLIVVPAPLEGSAQPAGDEAAPPPAPAGQPAADTDLAGLVSAPTMVITTGPPAAARAADIPERADPPIPVDDPAAGLFGSLPWREPVDEMPVDEMPVDEMPVGAPLADAPQADAVPADNAQADAPQADIPFGPDAWLDTAAAPPPRPPAAEEPPAFDPLPPAAGPDAGYPSDPAYPGEAYPAEPPYAGGDTAIGTPSVSTPDEPAPAPIVPAVLCHNQHLNAPWAQTCAACGAAVAPQAPFGAPRPPLGVLVLPDGARVLLDRDALLGRAPYAVNRDGANLVALPSPNNDISRSHVRVALDGWLVQVTDLGSTNGTIVHMPSDEPVRLRAHDPFTILPGTVVSIADEVDIRYEVGQGSAG